MLKSSYIKDYDGGTLMEAYVNPEICYSELSDTIKKQKEFLIKQISKHLNYSQTYKFSDLEKVLKKHKFDEEKEPKISELLFINLPGVVDGNWDYKDYLNLANNVNTNVNFYSQCKNIIQKLKSNKNSWPFLKPVDYKEVPDYYEVIKEPMGNKIKLTILDVRTLEQNLESGTYKNKDSFIKDIKKIFTNAKTYNKSFTIYHKYAKDLEFLVEEDLKNLNDLI